jgi:hypothetical protein
VQGVRRHAPLSHGLPCEHYHEFIAHGAGCERGCNPCPNVIGAIALLGEWVEARTLMSRAAWARVEQDRVGGTA